MKNQCFGNAHTANMYVRAIPKTQSLIITSNKHLISNSHKGLEIQKNGFTFVISNNSRYIDIQFDFIVF